MNIRPLYDRILVKRIEEQESTYKGIIIPSAMASGLRTAN
jgi:co-chaperonin GroES (HSP10)